MIVVGVYGLAGLDMDIAAMIRVDGQALFLHGLKVRAARKKRHFIPRIGEIAADDAARAADTENSKFHIIRSSF